MRHALYLPPFGELADPRAVADVAVAAEESGWDGVFLWDHLLRTEAGAGAVADVTVALAAVAVATDRVRLGAMVTPVSRRRPQKLAREIISLDQLAEGRLICGFGLGVDTARELSGFGEVVDPRRRAELLDEGVEVLDALLRGERVEHRGAHFVADGVTYEPRPVQRPRPPFWFAARQGARRPVRRAARYEGLFPIEVDADQLADDLELVAEQRGSLDGFDVAVLTHAGLALEPFVAAGATWAMHAIAPGTTVDGVLATVAEAERPGP